jgi:phosphoglycolate phosphatase
MFQSIIWDFDGTLVDTYPAIARAVNTALASFGKAAALSRVIELSSISLERCIKTLAADYDLPLEAFDARFALAYRAITPTDQLPFPGIVSICDYCLATGRQCFIVTHRRKASLHHW